MPAWSILKLAGWRVSTFPAEYDVTDSVQITGGRDEEVELLLPFSKEAEQLYFDIELIRYVSSQILIAASSQLKMCFSANQPLEWTRKSSAALRASSLVAPLSLGVGAKGNDQ